MIDFAEFAFKYSLNGGDRDIVNDSAKEVFIYDDMINDNIHQCSYYLRRANLMINFLRLFDSSLWLFHVFYHASSYLSAVEMHSTKMC